MATFLAIESETQKEILNQDAINIEDITLGNNGENPYFVQNLLNVMNNRKVDLSSEKGSIERSLDKRKTMNTIAMRNYSNQCKRQNIASKIANAKNERMDKSPVMKYLSISLVKENKQGSIPRKI